jgi:hypothetical protein
VHHTDAEREYAYDRKSPVGKFDKALDEAAAVGWTVVSMKDDWTAIFPPPRYSHLMWFGTERCYRFEPFMFVLSSYEADVIKP